MDRTKLFLIGVSIVVLAFTGRAIFASGGVDSATSLSPSPTSTVSVTSLHGRVHNKDVEEDTETEDEDEEHEDRVRVNDNEFEIRGEVTAIDGKNFTVAGQAVSINLKEVKKFEQKGVLAAGRTVRVSGVIKNNTKFAEKISTVGKDQGRLEFKFKEEAKSLSSPSASPSVLGHDTKVKVKASGSSDQIALFLEEILSFFKNLV